MWQLAGSEKVVFRQAQLEEQLGGPLRPVGWLEEVRGLEHHTAHFHWGRASGVSEPTAPVSDEGSLLLGVAITGPRGWGRAERRPPREVSQGGAEPSPLPRPTHSELRDLMSHLRFTHGQPEAKGVMVMVTRGPVAGSEKK